MKFKKREFTIDAMQLTADNLDDVAAWIVQTAPNSAAGPAGIDEGGNRALSWSAFDREQIALVGTWIIQDLRGEHYPCPASEFAILYKPDDLEFRSMVDVHKTARDAVEAAGQAALGREFDATLHHDLIDAAYTAAFASATAIFVKNIEIGSSTK